MFFLQLLLWQFNKNVVAKATNIHHLCKAKRKMQKIMRKILSLTLVLCLVLMNGWTQEVWPGDVNNNGKADGVDLLFWGLAYGAEGPARADETTDWSAQPLTTLWASSFPNGLNFAYADCNGDGIVNEDDFSSAIDDNFGLEHPPVTANGYANGSGNAPRLRLTPSATLVEEGAMVSIGLSIEDTDQPISAFYGMAIKMSYTTGLLQGDDGPDFDLTENGWVEIDESYVQELYVDGDGSGMAELALTRTNQMTVAVGSGDLGVFSIIVEDIIVGLEIDTFTLRIDSVLLIDEHFGMTPIIPDTTQIIIAKDTSKLTSASHYPSIQEGAAGLVVYPNPATHFLQISTPVGIEQLILVDQLGRAEVILDSAVPKGNYRYDVGDRQPGVYWLKIRTTAGMLSRKLVIAPG